MSVREHWINVRVNSEELARIREKQKELGIRNTGAYMRKMAMDGYCVNLDLSDVAQVSTLLRRCSNNARLAELDALLNMDDRGNDDPDREKTAEKPSVLAELRDRAGRIPPMAHRDDEEVAL